MAKGSAHRGSAARMSAADEASWAELRDLLVGPERAAIAALIERLDDPRRRAEETGAILPEALRARAGDEELKSVLMPSVEEAIRISVERDPRVLVNAIFPIIGPAIRKAVSTTLSSMVQSLNETLDRAFSLDGVKWRIEAFRTGRPFSEVVLLRTLEYAVEEVFLVHAETGLLLQHVVDPGTRGQDPQTVSGMLSAIREFVSDSFQIEAGGSLEGVKVGDLTVLVEAGPLASLVGVVRGTVPAELREVFQKTIEDIHSGYGHRLASYAGDSRPFEALIPQLESCLKKQYRPPPGSGRKLAWLGATATALLLVVAGHATWTQVRWSGYLAAIEAEDGLVVVERGRSWRSYHITGLRDPLAADPETLLQEKGLDPDAVSSRWHIFYSDSPDLVLSRAARLLEPPDGVELRLEQHTLQPVGEAPRDWGEQASQLARFVPGVAGYDGSLLTGGAAAEIGELSSAIEALEIQFDRGSVGVRADAVPAMSDVASLVERLAARSRAEGVTLRIAVVGHTDASGNPARNTLLAEGRARAVAAALEGLGIDRNLITFHGAGSSVPAAGAQSPFDAIHRRVTFEVRISEIGTASTADR